MVVRHIAETASRSHSDVACAQQIKGELPPVTPCTVGTGDIDQCIECAVGGVDVATKVLEKAHREIATSVIGIVHFGYAGLWAG